MPPPKLHLNEHLSPRLAAQLRQHGFDVTSTLEMGMVEADDDEQLAFAATEQRAIVTLCAGSTNSSDKHQAKSRRARRAMNRSRIVTAVIICFAASAFFALSSINANSKNKGKAVT
ncbi:MAG: DUF5615 family PIN-like protein, partial [Blastocatellia bacterium]